MPDVTYVSNVTVIPADWLNEINDFYHTTFGATGGPAYIGDNANTKVTIGLTINQAGNDDEILSLKSSDVAHGVTNETETDTYGYLKKYVAASGGLSIFGLTEATVGLHGGGVVTTGISTKTASSFGAISLTGYLKSGTTVGALGADDNILAIDSNGSVKFLFSNSGYSYHFGGLAITDGVTAPSAVTGYAVIYVDTTDGDLKVKFGDGTTKTLATDT